MANSRSGDDLHAYIVRLLIAAAIFGLLWLAWYLRDLLLLVFGAVLVSVILRLLAAPIHDRLRINSGLALALAALIMLAMVGIVLWFFGAEIGRQTEALGQMLPDAWHSLQGRLERAGLGEPVRNAIQDLRDGLIANVGRFALTVTNALGDTLLVIVGGIYLAAQPQLYRIGVVKMIPGGQRELAAEAIGEAGNALRLWLRGRMVSMIVVAMLTAFGLWVIGVPSWLSLGLLSGLLEFVPFLGPIVSAVPAVLLALAYSPEAALWTVGLYLLVQQIEGNLIEPLIQQRVVSIPPMLLLFAVIAAALLFGLGGIVLGAPFTVVIYVLVKRLYVREALHTDTPLPPKSK